jgi:hypothetical protein
LHNRLDRPTNDQRGTLVKDIRTKIAAGATILGLGGLAGYALHSNDSLPPAPQSTPAAAHLRPKVRTQTIRRTIHVRPHPKPADPAEATSAPASAAPAPAPAASAPAPAPTPAVATIPVSPPKPVTTHTSGGGSAGSGSISGDDEDENEGFQTEQADD